MKHFDKIMGTIESSLGVLFLVSMVALIFMQVVMRYVFNHALSWSEEMSRYLMIWCVGFGISSGVRAGSHIGIQAVVDAVPKKMGHFVRFICDLLVLAIFVFLSYAAVLFANSALISGQLTPSLRIPIFYVYAALPISFVFCVARQTQVIMMRYVFHDKVLSGEDFMV